MRCYQHYGLTGEAQVWLDKNCRKIITKSCPKCDHPLATGFEVIDEKEEDAFYGDGPTLHTYRTISGKKVKEIVQAMPWSSGPCGFLCLELEDGIRIGEWSQEEINLC